MNLTFLGHSKKLQQPLQHYSKEGSFKKQNKKQTKKHHQKGGAGNQKKTGQTKTAERSDSRFCILSFQAL